LRKAARAIPAMSNLTIPDGFTAARATLAEAGVALTFVREVPGTRVCGATWWLGAERPAIGLTARGRKPDTFWFSLLHEVAHILLHPRRTTFLDLDTDKTVTDPAEDQANDFAERTLLPDDARDRIAQATTREQLLRLAAKLGIGVTIVAGHHGYATNNWHVGGSLRGKITDADIDTLEEISVTGDSGLTIFPALKAEPGVQPEKYSRSGPLSISLLTPPKRLVRRR
jgi:HTH-type transcriptional regulator/antitoxin HigA